MTLTPSAVWDELDWRRSRLKTEPILNGYLSRGLLSVIAKSRKEEKYIAYGGFDRDKNQSVEKAVSEMVERMAWFACLHTLASHGTSISTFSTVGWAAHTSLEHSISSSRGEFLERCFFEVLLARLLHNPVSHSVCACTRLMNSSEFEGVPRESVNFGLEIEVRVPREDIYLTYVLLCCALDRKDTGRFGVTFGMGHSENRRKAVDTARIEAFLVTSAVRKLVNAEPSERQRKSLS